MRRLSWLPPLFQNLCTVGTAQRLWTQVSSGLSAGIPLSCQEALEPPSEHWIDAWQHAFTWSKLSYRLEPGQLSLDPTQRSFFSPTNSRRRDLAGSGSIGKGSAKAARVKGSQSQTSAGGQGAQLAVPSQEAQHLSACWSNPGIHAPRSGGRSKAHSSRPKKAGSSAGRMPSVRCDRRLQPNHVG